MRINRKLLVWIISGIFLLSLTSTVFAQGSISVKQKISELLLTAFGELPGEVKIKEINKTGYTGVYSFSSGEIKGKAVLFGKTVKNLVIEIMGGKEELMKFNRVSEMVKESLKILGAPTTKIKVKIDNFSIFDPSALSSENWSGKMWEWNSSVIWINFTLCFSIGEKNPSVILEATYFVPKWNKSDLLLCSEKVSTLNGEKESFELNFTGLRSVGTGVDKVVKAIEDFGTFLGIGAGNLKEINVTLYGNYEYNLKKFCYLLKEEMESLESSVKGIAEIKIPFSGGSILLKNLEMREGKVCKMGIEVLPDHVKNASEMLRKTPSFLKYIGKEFDSLMLYEIGKGLLMSNEVNYNGEEYFLEEGDQHLEVISEGKAPFQFSAEISGGALNLLFSVKNWEEVYPASKEVFPGFSQREAYFIALSALNLTIYQVGEWTCEKREITWGGIKYEYYVVKLMRRTSNGEAIPTILRISPNGTVAGVEELPVTCKLPPYTGPSLAAITLGILGIAFFALRRTRKPRSIFFIR